MRRGIIAAAGGVAAGGGQTPRGTGVYLQIETASGWSPGRFTINVTAQTVRAFPPSGPTYTWAQLGLQQGPPGDWYQSNGYHYVWDPASN
jgi:hypothetical protein